MVTGVVLAGGAARGAYEIGVLGYIVKDVASSIGHWPHFDVISGTSVGAIHACALAAFADHPLVGVGRLSDAWRQLHLRDVLHFEAGEALTLASSLAGFAHHPPQGALLSMAPFEAAIREQIPFAGIRRQLAAGHLQAVTVTATHVATGRAVVFVETAGTLSPEASALQPAHLELRHAMASAAVPFLFAPVDIDGQLYCDGGLRQLVPLSPALRLGAEALLVINPAAQAQEGAAPRPDREQAASSPIYLLGKALDAMLLGHIDEDLDRLEQTNAILRAGARQYGASYLPDLNRELRRESGHELRPVNVLAIRPSCELGALAADFVHSKIFARLARGPVGYLLRRLADADGSRDTDLVSYMLFEGEYAAQLIELGHSDAQAHHEELCALFQADGATARPAPAPLP